jgi:ribosomal protein S27E
MAAEEALLAAYVGKRRQIPRVGEYEFFVVLCWNEMNVCFGSASRERGCAGCGY